MANSMKFVLLSTLLLTSHAGFWSGGGSGFLSPRIPNTHDFDMRSAVQNKLQTAGSLTPMVSGIPAAVGRGRQETVDAVDSLDAPRATVHAKTNVSVGEVPVATLNSAEMPTTPAVDQKPRRKERSGRRKRPTRRSAEASLIDSLRHLGKDGEQAVVCVTSCRYGEEARHEWSECLERCVKNPLMRSTMLGLLPEEAHKAHSTAVEVPELLQKRLEHKRQRSAEL